MKPLRYVPVLALVAFASLVQADEQIRFTGKCVGVSDGDTITVLVGKKQWRIRIEGVDCPETGQPFADKAKRFTSEQVFGKQVSAVLLDTDRYGRLICRINTPEGKDLSSELLKAGLAWHYKQFNRERALAQLEDRARKAGIGIWSVKDPVAPWDHRRAKVKPKRYGPPADGKTIVYVTPTGKKYHRKDCRFAGNGKPKPLDEARGLGLEPCGVCHPPE